MPHLRKIVFYIFAAIYLVVCPLLILRLLGFIFDPQTYRFVKTGIIYASSNPPGADVYVNHIRAPETTPTVIRDLTPDNYTITLKLDGYQEWKNTIPVVARKATILENILLTPPQWIIKPLNGTTFENMLPLGEESSLLIWHKKTVKDLYHLRLNKTSSEDINNKIESSLISPLFPEEFIYKDAQITRFFTIEKSPFFIIHIVVDSKDKYLWIDPRDRQVHIEDISDLIPLEPDKIWWEPGDEKIIYVYYPTQVNRVDIKAKAIYPDIQLKDVPIPKKPLFNVANIKGSVPDENRSQWLLFTNTKIGIWNNSSKSLLWIFQNGRNIQKVFWANNASTILFQDNKDIYLLDKVIFGQTRIQKITTIRADASFFYSEKTGKIYFIEPHENLLSTVQVLRHTALSPRIIAEKLRLQDL